MWLVRLRCRGRAIGSGGLGEATRWAALAPEVRMTIIREAALEALRTHRNVEERDACAFAEQLRVSVVVPTLNEAQNIPHVFSRLPADVYEVVLVDGCSRDDTVAVAQAIRPSVRILLQHRPGKGAAIASGFAAARGDIVVMLDADGSNDPAEIPRFIDALIRGADFAKGSRFMPGGASVDITRLRRFGNRVLSGTVNALF